MKAKYIFIIVLLAIMAGCNKLMSQDNNTDDVLSAEPTNLSNQRIVEVIKQKDYSKDFKMMPYCFDKNVIINDTLIVQFYTQNLTYPDNDRKDAFSFDNGVLDFSDDLINNVVDSIVTIDEKTGERTVSYVYTTGHVSLQQELGSWQSSQKRTYKLVGFKEVPSVIQFQGDTLCACPPLNR